MAAPMERPASQTVRLPELLDTGGTLELSPYDLCNKGRSTPMTWFYGDTLDTPQLLDSLTTTLASYPVFCGRYNASPPTAVDLNNAGVPVQISIHPSTLSEAVAHLPPSGKASVFLRTAHEPFVPTKEPMDPDQGSTEAPLMSIKITTFAGGGTAIGILAQHCVVDAEAQILFMRHWACAYRGLPLLPPPVHARCYVDKAVADAPIERPDGFRVHAIKPGEQHMPEFVGVMPQINGPSVCIVPLDGEALATLKAEASAELPPGAYVSTDDVLTAHVWRTLCAMRCEQLGIPVDSDEMTTCHRPVNFRKRIEVPLAEGYVGNAISQVLTDMSVRELLSSHPSAVAHRLRSDLLSQHSPTMVKERARWLAHVMRGGGKAKMVFDAKALTFIVSSWNFAWEDAAFDAAPLAFDHGAIVPIVAVLVPRPKADGLFVYASGPQASVEQFARTMGQLGAR